MLVRRVAIRSGSPCRSHGRRGVGIAWFLVTAPVLALVAVWAVHSASLYHRQAELQVAAEAIALGSARELVHDLLLTELSERADFVEQRGRTAGRDLAKLNHVMSRPIQLRDNRRNDPNGELTIGTLANPFTHDFDASRLGHPDLYHPNRNAVRVALKRCGVAASATAFVDRDVCGFKIQGAMSLPEQSIPAIPVMPLALFTDPAFDREDADDEDPAKCMERWAARDRRSWEYQILARRGTDQFRWDQNGDGKPEVRRVKEKDGEPGDGIREMRVTLRAGPSQNENGQLALIGVENAREAASQLSTGITFQQLADRNGQLVLGQDEKGSTPRNELELPRRIMTEDELEYLREQLRRIVGQPRVWMLYSQVLEGKKSDGTLKVVGFVAARVLAVEGAAHDEHKKAEPTTLEVVLQPCMLITATAVTDCHRRDHGPRTLFNPYVGKVRLVE